jgi:hypothetical protein
MQPAKSNQEIYESFAAARKEAGLPPLPMPSQTFNVDVFRQDSEEIQKKLDENSEIVQKLKRIRAMCNKNKAETTIASHPASHFTDTLVGLLANTLKDLMAEIEAQTIKCSTASSLTDISALQHALSDAASSSEDVWTVVSELITTLTGIQKK